VKEPLLYVHNYLGFSKAFRQSHPEVVRQAWARLKTSGTARMDQLVGAYTASAATAAPQKKTAPQRGLAKP